MFEYKIGDRVVIVDYEDALRRDEFPKFVLDMRRYCGKEVTIRDISIECGEKILRFDEIPKKRAYYDISEYKNSERLVMRDYDPEYYHHEGFQIIGIDQHADLYPQEIDVTSFISI